MKAVILDRDGTLNRTTDILRPGQGPGDKTDGYVLKPEELDLFPTTKPALKLLRENGITPFVYTQQNCIGKGLVTKEEIDAVHAHMNAVLGEGARIEAFKLAWQVPGAEPDPRAKPSPAMILEIMEEYGLAPSDVVAVGDSKRDYKSAEAAGVDFIWIRDDLQRVPEADMTATDCPVFDDVLQMAEWLISGRTDRPR